MSLLQYIVSNEVLDCLVLLTFIDVFLCGNVCSIVAFELGLCIY